MSRRLKTATREDAENIAIGIAMLKKARDLFTQAGAPKTAKRIRLALTSASGAQRNVLACIHRAERAT
jgi:hypothetical protein